MKKSFQFNFTELSCSNIDVIASNSNDDDDDDATAGGSVGIISHHGIAWDG